MGEPKICTLCGGDCAGLPRTKDKRGRYFHEACYARAKAAQRARREAEAMAPPAPPSPPPALENVDPELLGEVLAEATATDHPPPVVPDEGRSVAAGVPCPACGTVMGAKNVICLDCGFNRQTGDKLGVRVEKPKRQWRTGAGGLIGQLTSPAGVSVLTLLFFGVFFAIVMTDPKVAVAYIVTQSIFQFAVGVTILVFAFREGVGQGLLTLCVPFYAIYFVFGVCENQYVKMLFIVMILSLAGAFYLQFDAMGQLGAFGP